MLRNGRPQSIWRLYKVIGAFVVSCPPSTVGCDDACARYLTKYYLKNWTGFSDNRSIRPFFYAKQKNRGADEHGAAAVLGSDLGSRSSVQLGIVDGQHRVGALMVMAERGGWNSTERNIMVDVFNATSDKDIADLFTEINRRVAVTMLKVVKHT